MGIESIKFQGNDIGYKGGSFNDWLGQNSQTALMDKAGLRFGNNGQMIGKDWYNGTLGIEPVDDLIKSGFDTGYIHHIGRLMVIGNFMNIIFDVFYVFSLS